MIWQTILLGGRSTQILAVWFLKLLMEFQLKNAEQFILVFNSKTLLMFGFKVFNFQQIIVNGKGLWLF